MPTATATPLVENDAAVATDFIYIHVGLRGVKSAQDALYNAFRAHRAGRGSPGERFLDFASPERDRFLADCSAQAVAVLVMAQDVSWYRSPRADQIQRGLTELGKAYTACISGHGLDPKPVALAVHVFADIGMTL